MITKMKTGSGTGGESSAVHAKGARKQRRMLVNVHNPQSRDSHSRRCTLSQSAEAHTLIPRHFRHTRSWNLVLIRKAPISQDAPGSTLGCRAARRAALFGTEFAPKKKKKKLGRREREAKKAEQPAGNTGTLSGSGT